MVLMFTVADCVSALNVAALVAVVPRAVEKVMVVADTARDVSLKLEEVVIPKLQLDVEALEPHAQAMVPLDNP